jgi:cytochrome c peroxidase
MKFSSLVLITLLSLVLGLVIAYVPSPYEMEVSKLSDEVRKKYQSKFPEYKKPKYLRIFGQDPNPKEIELGRLLFSDPILSRNNDVSCATCHLANHGFADGNPLIAGALGTGGPTGDTVGDNFATGELSLNRSLGDDGLGFFGRDFMFRNTLSTLNVVYRINTFKNHGLFHDGRFGSIVFQVLLPIHTAEEMCGKNPIALNEKGENIFREGGPLFKTPVHLKHTNTFDGYTGQDTGGFNFVEMDINGVPYRRKNNNFSVPNRNECLAITVAKIRSVPRYQKLFKEIYKKDTEAVNDKNLSRALASFVTSHVAHRTPYDKFTQGKESLTPKQLLGMAIFFEDTNEEFELNGKKHRGAGCMNCHDSWTFGGKGFASLGVKSDPKSPLSHDQLVFGSNSGFFARVEEQRGQLPKCLIEGITVLKSSNYAPDVGRANGSFKVEDCFKFRIPPLRNVVETYPYFHHGTLTARGEKYNSHIERSVAALEKTIRYHLRGPVNINLHNKMDPLKPWADKYFQMDYLIPYPLMNFHRKKGKPDHSKFPIKLSDEEVEALTEFVAFGLWDRKATQEGFFGNDLSHPRRVPSGFTPTISRDHGTQLELPPNGQY